MTITSSSTFPAMKAGLVELLQAAPDLAGVTVSYGSPQGGPEREHVILGGTGDADMEWVSVGGYHTDETYSILFWVHVAGDKQQEVTERAFALFDAVLSVGRNAVPTLDQLAAGAWNLRVKPVRVDEYETDDNGHGCIVSGEISCSARI